ncbi:MAG: hypothetical protein IKK89_00145 [Alistipes sp.]|nr:hypothetical protein [Alistipes sp.]MBR3892797.1 hypothetical protein [Alistipes sp.]MBR6630337.1 hypothetical protein [Alistipes sp.]
MIKRIIGTLFTLATLAVVVFAVLNYHNYKSMLFERDLYEMLFVRNTADEPQKESIEVIEETVEEDIVNEAITEQEEQEEESTESVI